MLFPHNAFQPSTSHFMCCFPATQNYDLRLPFGQPAFAFTPWARLEPPVTLASSLSAAFSGLHVSTSKAQVSAQIPGDCDGSFPSLWKLWLFPTFPPLFINQQLIHGRTFLFIPWQLSFLWREVFKSPLKIQVYYLYMSLRSVDLKDIFYVWKSDFHVFFFFFLWLWLLLYDLFDILIIFLWNFMNIIMSEE